MEATHDHAAAALTAARGAGLAVDRAQVVTVAANVLVRLTGPQPPPYAARLTGATAPFRDSAANLRREARLAAALADAGAPVVAPLGGPFEAGGRAVTLWPWLELEGHAGDAAAAGRALRECHDALAGIDPEGLELEPLAMLVEARRMAAAAGADVAAVVGPAVDRALATLGAAPARIVHGDSHPGNVLWSAGGPLWGDWEDAHLGPLEWDLACLVASARVHGDDFGWAQAALEAHAGPFDVALLEACVDARVAQGAPYLAATGRGDPEALHRRLDWLGRGA